MFAFDAMDKHATDIAVYAYYQDTLHGFSSDEHLFIVGPYIRTHRRHYLQQSRYTMCVRLKVQGNGESRRVDYAFCPHEHALNDSPNRDTDLFIKLKVAADQRRNALRELDSMNVNPFSVVGSKDALIHTVARRECLFDSWKL